MANYTIHESCLELHGKEVVVIETKEDIIQTLEKIMESDWLTRAEAKHLTKNIVDSDAFKAEDFLFYISVIRSKIIPPTVVCSEVINAEVSLTEAYIRSSKLIPDHYDLAFQREPKIFIKSEYFTLKEFDRYYQTDLKNLSFVCKHVIREWMLQRLQDL